MVRKRSESDGDAAVLEEISPLGEQPAGASAALPGLDGRSQLARRLKEIRVGLFGDLGGEGRASEAERLLIDRAAVLTLELESREARAASGQEPLDLPTYLSAVRTLGTVLERIGPRRPRDVSPAAAAAGGGEPDVRLYDVLKGGRA